MTIGYGDLLSADPEDFRSCGRKLTTVLHAVAAAEHTFQTRVADPLGGMTDWTGGAAVNASGTAKAHQRALSVVRLELAAAAKAVALFAEDVLTMKTNLENAALTARGAGVTVEDDGSTKVSNMTVVAGVPGAVDPHRLNEAYAAESHFKSTRDAILTEINELDRGCAKLLGTIREDAAHLYIDKNNVRPTVNLDTNPPGLAEIELDLNLDPDAGSDATAAERLLEASSALAQLTDSTLDGGEAVRTSVRDAAKALRNSPDPAVRSAASRILLQLGKPSRFFASDLAKLGSHALPAVDFALNVAKYSHDSNSVLEVVEKSGITTAASAAGALIGASTAGPFCAAIGAPDGEIGGVACEGVAALIGALFGAKGGEKVGDKIDTAIFDREGVPDPFAVQYRAG